MDLCRAVSGLGERATSLSCTVRELIERELPVIFQRSTTRFRNWATNASTSKRGPRGGSCPRHLGLHRVGAVEGAGADVDELVGGHPVALSQVKLC
jgi:hypothetical protein